ncbi:hypothetical protein PG987_014665 [Apiospora arundinis]
MSSSLPEGQRRGSAPSLFQRLGFFKRQPKSKQIDYRERWPTVTTLVEQRSEPCFFEEPKPPKKPAKVRALRTASISLRWLHHRLESVQDHLDHSIEAAEAKAQKRASLSEKPTAPGKSRHPYNTGVESHTRENAEREEEDMESTGTVQRLETQTTAEPSPPRSENRWRLPFKGTIKFSPPQQPAPASPTPAASEASNEGTEGDVTASHVSRPQWKSAKDRRPSKYPERKTHHGIDSDRASSTHTKKSESHHTNTPMVASPEPSLRSSKKQRPHSNHSRGTSVESSKRRQSTSKKSTPTPRTLTPMSHATTAAALPNEPAYQQTARRISGQLVQAIALLSPQSRSRTTSANRGMEHAQQQQKRDRKTPVATASGRTADNSAVTTPQDQHQADPMGEPLTMTASPEMLTTDSTPKSTKSPKAGAFRHLLGVVKGGLPPSRAVSPLSIHGDETEKAKTGKQPE